MVYSMPSPQEVWSGVALRGVVAGGAGEVEQVGPIAAGRCGKLDLELELELELGPPFRSFAPTTVTGARVLARRDRRSSNAPSMNAS